MGNLEELLKTNFKFNKKFGQNFITDINLLSAIVKDAKIEKTTCVLEIGTGAGTLTNEISKVAKSVVSYEIDTNLKGYLEELFKNKDNVELIFKDILQEKMENIEAKFNEDYVMIANLPYYITTPIIFKFIENSRKISALYIMVQLEVANRICAKPNTSEYGAITAVIDSIADAKITRRVSRNLFTPKPNVDSAIVEIKLNRNKYSIRDIENLRLVIKSAFAMRRKTLENNLKTSFKFNSGKINQMFETLGIKNGVRGETLSAKQFVEISNYIVENKLI